MGLLASQCMPALACAWCSSICPICNTSTEHLNGAPLFAGLGVIHRGNVGKSRTIMAPYLPSAPGGSTPSAYSGG